MKHYYALFRRTKEAIEVEFPDLEGCVTFAKDWDAAYTNAVDALAAWLANTESQFINEPSSHEKLKTCKGNLVPIPVDEKIIDSYRPQKRFNVIFPTDTLQKVDSYRKEIGLKRSTFLQQAAEDYLRRVRKRAS